MEDKPYVHDGKRITAEEYKKMKYEDLRVRVLKGRKAEIQAHATNKGISLNGFINQAIDEKMERDNKTDAQQ